MKTFNEYTEEIENLKRQRETNLNSVKELKSQEKWTTEKIKKIDEIKKENNVIDLKLAYLICNAKHALFNEKFPDFYRILEKFNGKPIGEKRKKAIHEEIKDKLNMVFYVRKYYSSDEIVASLVKPTGNANTLYELIIYTKPDKKLTKENKLTLPPLEEFIIGYSNCKYTENVDEAVNKLLSKHKELKDIKEKFKTVAKEYNELRVEYIDAISDTEDINSIPKVEIKLD